MRNRQFLSNGVQDYPGSAYRDEPDWKQKLRAQKLAGHTAKNLLSSGKRYRGIGLLRELSCRAPSVTDAAKDTLPKQPVPKPAKLTELRIDEPVMVDGTKYTVHRLTYRPQTGNCSPKCVVELLDRRGERLWVGDGQLFEVRADISSTSFRLKKFQTLRRPEAEAEYV